MFKSIFEYSQNQLMKILKIASISLSIAYCFIFLYWMSFITISLLSSGSYFQQYSNQYFVQFIQYFMYFHHYKNDQVSLNVILFVLIFEIVIILLLIYALIIASDDKTKIANYINGYYYYSLQYYIFPFLINSQINFLKDIITQEFQMLITFLFFNLLLLFIILIFTIILNTYFFNYSFISSDQLSRNPSQFFMINTFFLILITISESLFQDYTSSINNFAFLFHSIFIIFISLKNYLYLNLNCEIFHLTMICIYSWCNFSICLQILIPIDSLQQNQEIIILSGVLCIIILKFMYQSKLLESIVTQQTKNIKTSSSVQQQIQTMVRLVLRKNNSKQVEMLIASIVSTHIEKCKNENCFCKNRSENVLPKTIEKGNPKIQNFQDKVFLFTLINHLFSKHPLIKTCPKLQLQQMIYQIEIFGNIFKAFDKLHYFFNSYKLLSISEYFIIKKIRGELPSIVEAQNKKPEIKYESIQYQTELLEDVKDNIHLLIQQNKIFWEFLFKGTLYQNKMEKIQNEIIHIKRKIDQIFRQLLATSKSCLTYEGLIYYYKKYVLFQPQEKNDIKKMIQNFIQQYNLREKLDESLHNKLSFVLFLQLTEKNWGKIIWCSKNSPQLINYEEKMINNLHINELIPNIIQPYHDIYITKYFEKGYSTFTENQNALWILNKQKHLLSSFVYVKPIIQNNQIQTVNNITIKDYENQIIISEKGEIDSVCFLYGNLTNYNNEGLGTYQIFSILIHIPQLIPFFLNYFYGIAHFKINGFDYEDFNYVIFYSFDKQEEMVSKLTHLLKGVTDIKQYCTNIYEYIKQINFSDIKTSYLIKFKITKQNYSENLSLWIFSILNYQQIKQIRESDFQHSKVFLEKLNFNNEIEYSISKYDYRKSEMIQFTKNEIIEKFHNKKNPRKSKLIRTNVSQKIEEMDNQKSKNIQNIEYKKKQDKALQIIKQIFIKNLNNNNNNFDSNSSQSKWTRAINNYYKANLGINDEIISLQIEDLPKAFNSNKFFCQELQNDLNQDLDEQNIIVQKLKKNNSVYEQENSKKTQIAIDIIENKLKQLKNQRRKISLVINYISLISLLIFIFFHMYTLLLMRDDSIIILNQKQYEKNRIFDDYYSWMLYNRSQILFYQSFINWENSQNPQMLYQPFSLEKEKQQIMVRIDRLQKKNNLLVDVLLNSQQERSNTYLEEFFEIKQDFLVKGSQRHLDFYQLFQQIRIENYSYFSSLDYNTDTYLVNIIEISTLLNGFQEKQIQIIIEQNSEIKNKLLIYFYVRYGLFFFINIGIVYLLYSLGMQSNRYLFLFSKISREDICYYNGYFKQFENFFIFNKSLTIKDIFQTFTLKNSKIKTKKITYQIFKMKKSIIFTILFIYSVFILCLLIPIIIEQRKIFIQTNELSEKMNFLFKLSQTNIFMSNIQLHIVIIIQICIQYYAFQLQFLEDIKGIVQTEITKLYSMLSDQNKFFQLSSLFGLSQTQNEYFQDFNYDYECEYQQELPQCDKCSKSQFIMSNYINYRYDMMLYLKNFLMQIQSKELFINYFLSDSFQLKTLFCMLNKGEIYNDINKQLMDSLYNNFLTYKNQIFSDLLFRTLFEVTAYLLCMILVFIFVQVKKFQKIQKLNFTSIKIFQNYTL